LDDFIPVGFEINDCHFFAGSSWRESMTREEYDKEMADLQRINELLEQLQAQCRKGNDDKDSAGNPGSQGVD
jgi:hypothetical protein